jgi:hypothetical protein
MGLPEIEAKTYEGKLKGRNVLVAVHTESADIRQAVKDVLHRHGARDVDTTSEASVPRDERRI